MTVLKLEFNVSKRNPTHQTKTKVFSYLPPILICGSQAIAKKMAVPGRKQTTKMSDIKLIIFTTFFSFTETISSLLFAVDVTAFRHFAVLLIFTIRMMVQIRTKIRQRVDKRTLWRRKVAVSIISLSRV